MTRLRRVAVVLQNRPFLGAVSMHLPMLHALRERHPECHVTLHSTTTVGAALVEAGVAHEHHVYTRDPIALTRRLVAGRPDAVVSFRRKSLRTHIPLALTGARVRVAFAHRVNALFFTHTVPLDKSRYRALAFLDVLEPLGVPVPRAGIPVSVDALARRSSWTSPTAGPLHCLMPCGSEDRKHWGLERFLAYGADRRATEPGIRFVFVLGPREAHMAGQIAASELGSISSTVCSAPLSTIAAVVRASDVVVTNDCAPGHVAQMSDRPTVVIFGNWDGRAAGRVGEWFHRRTGTLAIVAPDGRGAGAVALRDVTSAVDRLIVAGAPVD